MRRLCLLVSLLSVAVVAPVSGAPTAAALAPGVTSLLRAGRPVRLRIGERVVTLRARPNPVLADDVTPMLLGAHEAPTARRPLTTYVGTIAELPDVRVRLGIGDSLSGMIMLPDGTALELRPRPDGGADLVSLARTHHRAIGEGDGIAPPITARTPASARGAAGRLHLRLAFEADYQFTLANATTWQDRLLEVVNLVEMVYDPQIDVEFEVTWLGAWTTPDPYVASHACYNPAQRRDGKLEQLGAYWSQNRTDVVRDTVHLAARRLTGAYIGCAYIGALGSYGYGVSAISSAPTALYDNVNLVSHEIGHNFDGLHERSIGRYGLLGSGSAAPYTIMNPTAVDGVLRFSDLTGVRSPQTGWELDNATPMRAHAEARLAPL